MGVKTSDPQVTENKKSSIKPKFSESAFCLKFPARTNIFLKFEFMNVSWKSIFNILKLIARSEYEPFSTKTFDAFLKEVFQKLNLFPIFL